MKRKLHLAKDHVSDLTPAELDQIGGGHKVQVVHTILGCLLTPVAAFSKPATECFTSCWQE